MKMNVESLNCMKRGALQKLAKQHGVRANMKSGDLIAALRAFIDASASFSAIEDTSLETSSEDVAFKVVVPSDDSTEERKLKRGRPTKKRRVADIVSSVSFDSISPSSVEDLWNEKPPWESESLTPQNKATTMKNISATFSVEKSKRQTRVPSVEKKNSPSPKKKQLKRRSTQAQDEVQIKRAKRSASSNKQGDDGSVEKVDEDLRNEIMKEIRKKVDADESTLVPKKRKDKFATQIPRFRASGVQIGSSKPITPGNKDWNKLHNKTFENYESIDDYERRKKERAEKLLFSNQKNVVTISRLAQPVKRGRPKIAKPVAGKGRPKPSFMSPVNQKTPRSCLRPTFSATKPTQPTVTKPAAAYKKEKASIAKVFVPSVTSTTNMNLDFASKTSKIATPKRVRIVPAAKKATASKIPAVVATPANPKTPNNQIKSAVTPFLTNSSVVGTPGSTKKNMFDLKQSLKKPLSWVPHKGPLRPYNDTNQKPTFKERMKNVKNPNISTRTTRREKMAAEKKDSKDKRMMLRRGIK